MSKVYCFGDSNGYGSELEYNEHPFVHWFAESLKLPYTNYAEPGASLGIILHRLIKHHTEISKDDIVLVVIPPDSRWYDENEEDGFYSLSNYMIEDYYHKFLNDKTLEWFEYHHGLFTYTIQKILEDIGCKYMMMLAYGRLGGVHYQLDIDYSKFLDQDIVRSLCVPIKDWDPYPHDIEPKEHRFMYDGPTDTYDPNSSYFQGKNSKPQGHPNELGHKLISELLLKKYYLLYEKN